LALSTVSDAPVRGLSDRTWPSGNQWRKLLWGDWRRLLTGHSGMGRFLDVLLYLGGRGGYKYPRVFIAGVGRQAWAAKGPIVGCSGPVTHHCR